MLEIRCTKLNGAHYNHDTLSIFDHDSREITIARKDIKELKHLLSGRSKRTFQDREESRKGDRK